MVIMRRKLPHTEGDFVYLPLTDGTGTYGLGLIARIGRSVSTLGYFFGARLSALPTRAYLAGLHAEDAVLISNFGNLYIMSGRWTIIPKLEEWDRNAWPIPNFGRVDVINHKEAWRVTLNEKLDTEFEERVNIDEILTLPYDVSSGARAVELKLTRLIKTKTKSTVETEKRYYTM